MREYLQNQIIVLVTNVVEEWSLNVKKLNLENKGVKMSHNTNCNALRNKFKCKDCPKGYMMEWALQNHLKVCPWKENTNEKENNN